MSIIKHITLILLLVAGANNYTQAPVTREYQLKAAFVYNFCQFVDWPASAFQNNQEPFVIGVLGSNPFGNYLEETVKEETVQSHPIVVQYFRNRKELKACHLLFINDETSATEILESLNGSATLTISDDPQFSQSGGMIRFITDDNKIRFAINAEAVNDAGLEMSSKLLRLADNYASGKK